MPKTFKDASDEAFRQGRDRDAFQLLYAHTLAALPLDDKSGIDMRWVTGLSRPVAAIRWGVGIQYSADKNFEGAPPQLGEAPRGGEQQGNNPGGPGAGGSGQGERKKMFGKSSGSKAPAPGGYGPGAPGIPGGPGGPGGAGNGESTEPHAMLRYYTGELGDKVLERLRKNISKGSYGDILKKALAESGGAAGGAGARQGGFPGGPPGAPPMGPPGGPPGYDPSAPGAGQAGGGKGKDQSAGQLLPGVVMLGEGTAKEILDMAREEGVDLLLVFEVSANRTRSWKETSDTKVRLVELPSGKDLHTSKKLNNIQVYDAREKPGSKSADPLDDVLELLFKAADEKGLKLGEFPAGLTADHIQTRYNKLLAGDPENPLPVLVELRHYYRLQLLPKNKLGEAYKKLLGDENAAVVASRKNTLEEKREALADWLPESLKLASADAKPAVGSGPGAGGIPGAAPGGIPGAAAGGYVPPGADAAGGNAPSDKTGVDGYVPPGTSATTETVPAKPGASAAAAASTNFFSVPGTRVKFPVPDGFTLEQEASGPKLVHEKLTIRFKFESRPLDTVLLDYSEANLAKGGFSLLDKRVMELLGQKITLMMAKHNDSNYKFQFSFVAIPENTVLVSSGSYPLDEAAKYEALFLKAFANLQPRFE